MVLQWPVRVKPCISCPNSANRSCTQSDLMKKHSRASHTCKRGATVAYPNRLSPPMSAISPPSLSRIHVLVLLAPLATSFFCKGLRDRTWHVARATDWSETGIIVFYRSGASNEYSPVLIRPAARATEAKVLGQTDKHTYIHRNKHRPTTFFQPPTRGNLRAKAFNGKVLKPFYSTILK